MNSISSGVFDVFTSGLEVVLAHVSPTEALALSLALVALVGTLVYAYRHRTGRCVTLNERLATEAATWRCRGCDTWSPVSVDVCTVCEYDRAGRDTRKAATR